MQINHSHLPSHTMNYDIFTSNTPKGVTHPFGRENSKSCELKEQAALKSMFAFQGPIRLSNTHPRYCLLHSKHFRSTSSLPLPHNPQFMHSTKNMPWEQSIHNQERDRRGKIEQ
eukprot:c36370_g1_i1 orf=364-705(+)